MPSVRKRTFAAAMEDSTDERPQSSQASSTLKTIRNMWQFANLVQFSMLFGNVLKIDEGFDIEDLEMECLNPNSMALQEIGLCFLKFLSSHRSLNHENFDEYSRRQFLAKDAAKNPFGDGEEPLRFADFDVYKKIRVLQQMSQLIMASSERLRDKTEEQKDAEQTNWRIEPYGWDKEDRTYFVLDDNRIYRLTEALPQEAAPKSKKSTTKARAPIRASKRRRVSPAEGSDNGEDDGTSIAINKDTMGEDDGLGGSKWECVAVTLDEVRQLVASIQKTKDSNEKVLRDQIQEHLVPILEKQEESRKRKIQQREKEMLSLEKMAHAKRSSRLAGKAEARRHEVQERQDALRRQEEEIAARKAEEAQRRMEEERERRLKSRGNRLRDRETRRLRHEEELAQLSEDSKTVSEGGAGRLSERRRQAEIERNKQALKELEEEEDEWTFDCVCGVYGQVDDGSHSVSCEVCNVWQHSGCLDIAEEEAERDDFHFICDSCRRREAEKDQPRTIKIKLNRPGSSASNTKQGLDDATPSRSDRMLVVDLESRVTSGTTQASEQDLQSETKANAVLPPAQPSPLHGAPTLSPGSQGRHAFSSPHPNLSPPDLSPTKSRAYSSIYEHSSPPTTAAGRPSVGMKQDTKMAGALAGNGVITSPSKQLHFPPPATTKNSPPLPAVSVVSGTPVAPPSPVNNIARTPHLVGTTLVTPNASQDLDREASYDERSSPLPPSRGGLSPTKHSPPRPQYSPRLGNGALSSSTNGITPVGDASPKHAVLPPGPALSPSPRQQILTPPVKSSEPAKPSARQPQDAQEQAPSSSF